MGRAPGAVGATLDGSARITARRWLPKLLSRAPLAGLGRYAFAAAVTLAAGGLISYVGYRLRDTWVGDAAVYLPYARNAANGHLFQFNIGQFSSGSTSPLWSLVLAIPFVLGGGLMAAKAFAVIAALGGYAASLMAVQRISRSWPAAAVASLLVVGTMTFYAVSLYESGLIVALSAMALIVGERTRERWRADGRLTPRAAAPLVLVWAALPLARPEAVILVAAQWVALLMSAPVPRRRAAVALLAVAAVAAIPSAAYFGYSVASLGTFSTSSQERAFALRESASRWLGPFYASTAAIRQLVTSPWVFGLIPGIAGLALMARARASRWMAIYGALAIAGYVFVLTFVAPGDYDTARYLLPIVPLLIVGIAHLITRLGARGPRVYVAAISVALVAISLPGINSLHDRVRFARSIGISEHEVFSRDVTTLLNRDAAPHAVVLCYEVQLRYFLRKDLSILSEDGITDGKVRPFQASPDMTAFLRRYRPTWWVGDNDPLVRPYMRSSILARAIRSFKADSAASSMTFDGIRFQLVARRRQPLARGFGGWQMLFKLSYS